MISLVIAGKLEKKGQVLKKEGENGKARTNVCQGPAPQKKNSRKKKTLGRKSYRQSENLKLTSKGGQRGERRGDKETKKK